MKLINNSMSEDEDFLIKMINDRLVMVCKECETPLIALHEFLVICPQCEKKDELNKT